MIKTYRGAEAEAIAPEIWASLPERVRRLIMWDSPSAEREGIFPKLLKAAERVIVGYGILSSPHKIEAVCWIVPLSPGSKAGVLHFAFADILSKRRYVIGHKALAACGYDSLLGFVPLPYEGTRRYALEMGFKSVAIMPGACWLADRNRLAGGELFLWTR